MPSSWLSAGAGASQGLEELLTRQRQDEIVRNNMAQHQGTLAETLRSHQAEEGIKQQEFGQREQDRKLATDNLETMRQAQRDNLQAQQDNLMRDDVRTRETLRPPGDTSVTPQEYAQVQKYGVLPMSRYEQSNGPPLPNGDSGPPLPIIKFLGTQPQLMAQQAEKDRVTQQAATNTRLDQGHADAMDNAKATRDLAAAQHGVTNEIAKSHLSLQQRALDDKEAERKAKEGEVKIGAKGQEHLESLQNAQDISARLLANIRAQHPDIEDPNAPPDMMGNKINQKYNTLGNMIGNKFDVAKYWAGKYDDQSSPMLQLENLLTPVQAGRYMGGSRNQKMLDLVIKHMANPGQTTAEQYSRLKTLQDITPAMRQAIVDAARPVKVDSSGKIIERSGGGDSTGSGLPPGVTVTRID